jgi:glycosyltransferase involved in cell wall biosynthesis
VTADSTKYQDAPGKQLLVSVVVPTYNRAHLIERTLESIFRQSYSNLEVIVVDDGSTDASESVIAACAETSTFPFRYYKKENGGCASARNAGVSLAAGGAIAFLDSDDEWLPEAIKDLVTTLEESKADFVYSQTFVSDGQQILVHPAAAGHPERFAVEHFMTTRAYPCSILYRRHVFDLYRNDESLRYNEDSDFLQKVAISFKAAYLDAPTAVVHHHSGSKSSNRVEINRALLKSARNILTAFPAFRATLAELADKRVAGIVAELTAELILEKRYGDVIELAADYRLGLLEKLSIILKTPHLVKSVRRARLLAGMMARIVGGAPRGA